MSLDLKQENSKFQSFYNNRVHLPNHVHSSLRTGPSDGLRYCILHMNGLSLVSSLSHHPSRANLPQELGWVTSGEKRWVIVYCVYIDQETEFK
jgi:hypothetical protein